MSRVSHSLKPLALTACLVAGCQGVNDAPVQPAAPVVPEPAIEAPVIVPGPSVPAKPSAARIQMEDSLKRQQEALLVRGLLREDGGGPDTAYTSADLARNFERIAFFNEYQRGGALGGGETEGRLSRWEDPVRIALHFGQTVPRKRQQGDRATITAYATRLARVTGHSIALNPQRANFFVLIANEDDRAALLHDFAQAHPWADGPARDTLDSLPDTVNCIAFSYPGLERPSQIERAIVFVRDEHPPKNRKACFDEEIAQALGLGNDSPDARPSVFNDDQEFGRLTRHDEQLLEMLYDPRLSPGMSLDSARPLIQTIAEEKAEPPLRVAAR